MGASEVNLEEGDFHSATSEQLQEILDLLEYPLSTESVRYLEMWVDRSWTPTGIDMDNIDYFIWWLTTQIPGR